MRFGGALVETRARSINHSSADSGRLGLYRTSGPNSFAWIGDQSGPDGIGGETRTLDTFVLARDVAPPLIRVKRPRAKGIEAGRPPIEAVITDAGSGFGWSDITTEIDGVTQIVVYDPESSRLSGTLLPLVQALTKRLCSSAPHR